MSQETAEPILTVQIKPEEPNAYKNMERTVASWGKCSWAETSAPEPSISELGNMEFRTNMQLGK